MKAPLVGITVRSDKDNRGVDCVTQKRAYLQAIELGGGIPFAITASPDVEALFRAYRICDALLLPGGYDIAPSRYGDDEVAGCELTSDSELDAAETQLAQWGLGDGKPILGICRGMQLLNVVLGGTLWQDIRNQGVSKVDHNSDPAVGSAHAINIVAGSRLASIAHAARTEVNSSHHQCVKKLGDGLSVTAKSDDGIIEAIELAGSGFILGLQCHPEDMTESPWTRRLFQTFVAAAQARELEGRGIRPQPLSANPDKDVVAGF